MTTGMWNAIDSVVHSDQLKKSYAGMYIRKFPNGNAPLFGLTSLLGTKQCLQFEHGFFSKTMLFPEVTIGGTPLIAGDTSIGVVSTTNILPGMVLRAQTTGENMVVNSITNATTMVVTRGVGVIAAGAVAAAVKMYVVGNAYEEGSTRPTNQYIVPARVTNYTQIFRNSWALTGTAAETQMIVGDSNVAENREECAMFHSADIEKALFFGQKFLGTKNSQPFHLMNGLVQSITTYASANITVAAATTNWTQLEAALDPCFNIMTDARNSMERTLFVGGTAHRVLNQIGRLNGTYQLIDGQTNFGLRFETLKMTRGIFRIVEHPLFNSNTDWAKMAIAIDLPMFKLAYLGSRKTQSKEYGMNGVPVDSGIDAVGGTLTTELTCEITTPETCAIITGLTAGAAG